MRSCAEWSILAGNADVVAAMIVGGWKVVMIAAAWRSGERSVGGGGSAGDNSHRFDLDQLVTIAKGDNAQRCARRVMLPKRGTGSPAAGPRRKPGRIGIV